VLSAALHLLPYAFLAALSPLSFAATLTVMRTGRLKALGFGLGVVFGQLFACTVLVVLGDVATPGRTKTHATFAALLELGAGLALLWLAAMIRRRPELMDRGSSGRSKAALDRLHRVHALTATGVGLLLGIGGPKRLLLAVLASATITASGITGTDRAVLIAWYALLATALVWLPVLAYLLLGDLVVAVLDAALEWLGRNRREATLYALVAIGLALVLDGLVRLL
jgi:Sap, sulfolipid-1-addressing protein